MPVAFTMLVPRPRLVNKLIQSSKGKKHDSQSQSFRNKSRRYSLSQIDCLNKKPNPALCSGWWQTPNSHRGLSHWPWPCCWKDAGRKLVPWLPMQSRYCQLSPCGSEVYNHIPSSVSRTRKGDAYVPPDRNLRFQDDDECSSDSGIEHLLG